MSIYNILQKIRRFSNNYIDVLQKLFKKYEQDFEDPLISKRWWWIWFIQILTLCISILINYLITKYA